jgi:RNA 2',3'-cyclic 3'-phosphodiesterase
VAGPSDDPTPPARRGRRPSGDPTAGRGRRPSDDPTPPARRSRRPPGDPTRLRLFVALELPEAVRAALAAFRDAAADRDVWRPIPPEALHLTLAFLGARPEDDVATIEGVLRAAAGPAPRLALGAGLLLPPRRARVLCVHVEDPDGTLAALQARVSDGLAGAGVYEPEKRPYRAHATVARLRPRQRPPRAIGAAPPEPLAFRGESVALFVSRLHPHGARYEALVRAPLN